MPANTPVETAVSFSSDRDDSNSPSPLLLPAPLIPLRSTASWESLESITEGDFEMTTGHFRLVTADQYGRPRMSRVRQHIHTYRPYVLFAEVDLVCSQCNLDTNECRYSHAMHTIQVFCGGQHRHVIQHGEVSIQFKYDGDGILFVTCYYANLPPSEREFRYALVPGNGTDVDSPDYWSEADMDWTLYDGESEYSLSSSAARDEYVGWEYSPAEFRHRDSRELYPIANSTGPMPELVPYRVAGWPSSPATDSETDDEDLQLRRFRTPHYMGGAFAELEEINSRVGVLIPME